MVQRVSGKSPVGPAANKTSFLKSLGGPASSVLHHPNSLGGVPALLCLDFLWLPSPPLCIFMDHFNALTFMPPGRLGTRLQSMLVTPNPKHRRFLASNYCLSMSQDHVYYHTNCSNIDM